jgi:hypothetical protein
MKWMPGAIGAMVLIYIVALVSSCGGQGYAGYNGYRRGPSFFYMGGPPIYYSPSNRSGSPGGPGSTGGGPRGGK